MGMSSAPARRTSSIRSWPAMTSASLLASSTRLPARTAARVGRQAGGADDRGHHHVAHSSRGDRLGQRLGAALDACR